MTLAEGTHGHRGRRAQSPWLPYAQANPSATLRLFCFPYAGGSALIYRSWAKHLPPGVEVCPVQLPGRGNRMRERPFTKLNELVPALADGLRPCLDKPFALFGHSMGALIGLELARELRRRGGPAPEHLFVSGRTAPQLGKLDENLYDLPEPELIEELRRLNGTPPEVLAHPELMELMLPILRADFSICDTYEYADEPPLSCPVTAFGGLGDTGVPRPTLEAWAAQTVASFSVRMLPGDHFFIHENEAALLALLARELHQLLVRCAR